MAKVEHDTLHELDWDSLAVGLIARLQNDGHQNIVDQVFEKSNVTENQREMLKYV